MFESKDIQALNAQVEELQDLLKQAEERRNAQYTDIMLAIKELTNAVEGILEERENDAEQKSVIFDEYYEEAKDFVIQERKVSTSLLQRRFKIGYGLAARIMDLLEENRIISPSDGTNKPREVIVSDEDTN